MKQMVVGKLISFYLHAVFYNLFPFSVMAAINTVIFKQNYLNHRCFSMFTIEDVFWHRISKQFLLVCVVHKIDARWHIGTFDSRIGLSKIF